MGRNSPRFASLRSEQPEPDRAVSVPYPVRAGALCAQRAVPREPKPPDSCEYRAVRYGQFRFLWSSNPRASTRLRLASAGRRYLWASLRPLEQACRSIGTPFVPPCRATRSAECPPPRVRRGAALALAARSLQIGTSPSRGGKHGVTRQCHPRHRAGHRVELLVAGGGCGWSRPAPGGYLRSVRHAEPSRCHPVPALR